MPARPTLPRRASSLVPDLPPADASKPDEAAIDDVYAAVARTGSLEAAAEKLAAIAAQQAEDGIVPAVVQRRQAWWDEEEDEDEEAAAAQYRHQMALAAQADEDDDGEVVVEHLQQVVDGLWIGDLVAAMDVEGLRERGIANVVSLLRPRLEFAPEFGTYAVEIDDAPETDILTHLPSTCAWIREALLRRQAGRARDAGDIEGAEEAEAELETRSRDIDKSAGETKPGGVLVHCQAGMSRSATVTAAFLMAELELDPVEAVSVVREARPVVDPSETFWHQLGLFYGAGARVTLKDRSTRQWYLERNAGLVMNHGSAPMTEMMRRYPATPSASTPATPAGGVGRRKIRCRMCRRHLAVREHMMDHILDQAPISRPRTPSNFALPAPLSSLTTEDGKADGDAVDDSPGEPRARRDSVVSDVINPLTGLPGATLSRRPSAASSRRPSVVSLTDSAPPGTPGRARSRSILGDALSMSTAPSRRPSSPTKLTTTAPPSGTSSGPVSAGMGPTPGSGSGPGGRPILDADQLAARLPPQLAALRAMSSTNASGTSALSSQASSPSSSPEPTEPEKTKRPEGPPRRLSNPTAFGGLAMTPAPGASPATQSPATATATGAGAQGYPFGNASGTNLPGAGTPILVNPKCSGYFVEPLTWMEPQIAAGGVSGKLVCPNEKCGVKIGNFDWAGVQCGCREWVTPGFCIHRSKVDEVW